MVVRQCEHFVCKHVVGWMSGVLLVKLKVCGLVC